jgi:uncharacterized protein YycO
MLRNLLLLFVLAMSSCKPSAEDVPKDNPSEILQDGDIIFQESTSEQSRAIQLATHSRYSHCGIIFKTADETYVFEAIQPVQSTPLKEWIKRGKAGHYVVKRLKNADEVLTGDVVSKMKILSGRYNDKDYDYYFEWNNKRIYCSELVWKVYRQSTGIELAGLQKLNEFDLQNPAVKDKLAERYGKEVPTDNKVISPAAIFESRLLETVISN